MAGPTSSAWVATTVTSGAQPASSRAFTAASMVPAVEIMSSTTMGAQPFTSPVMLRACTSEPLVRCLWTTATGSFSCAA